jgi:hypothetical protein
VALSIRSNLRAPASGKHRRGTGEKWFPTPPAELPGVPRASLRSFRIDRAAVAVLKASSIALIERYPFSGILG